MTAEQQLERSVLEGKERDELHAIAQALSVKTTTRTKKADMIDSILKATGVSVDGAVTTNSGAGDSGGAASGSTNGRGNGSSPASTGGPVPDRSDPAGDEDGSPASQGPGRRPPVTLSFGPDDEAKATGFDGTELDVPAPDSDSDSDSAAGGDESVPTATEVAPDSRRNGQGQSGPNSQGGRQNNQGGRQNNQGGRQNNQNNQGNRQSNQGNRQGTQENRQGGSDDAGNRRNNRRRRGRDRPGDGGERDLQGAGGNQEQQYQGELLPVKGLLDLRDEGYGFLRCDGYLPSSKDVYVSISQARR
ncbi:MAG: Rho termination factor N-terminal domain-containing protein, partial [Acidimicrobiales bacterium]